jgi:hypothetical protein
MPGLGSSAAGDNAKPQDAFVFVWMDAGLREDFVGQRVEGCDSFP